MGYALLNWGRGINVDQTDKTVIALLLQYGISIEFLQLRKTSSD